MALVCLRRTLLSVCVVIWLGATEVSAQADQPLAAAVTVDEVVHQLVDRNQDRASQLRSYTSRRHYHIEYKGFPHSADANMEVETIYSAPAKTFRVLSESGSRALVKHVLEKLLKAEQDAAAVQRTNALTPENYNFALLETTAEDERTVFVLQVNPKAASKFLYRGKIWVDAEDYAVVRVEAEPSESPSFWIRNTQIRHLYTKVGAFWLPKQSTTVTKVRLGGTATLTIDFEKYEFPTAANQTFRKQQGSRELGQAAVAPIVDRSFWDRAISASASFQSHGCDCRGRSAIRLDGSSRQNSLKDQTNGRFLLACELGSGQALH